MALRKRPARQENPEGRMPLMEHLRELRNRLFKAAIALVLGAIIGYVVFPYVWHVLQGPYCRIPQTSRPDHLGGAQQCTLYVTGLFDSFFLRLKVAIITGVVLSSPVWLYQLWAFVAPGLHRREKKWAYTFVSAAFPLFALGAVLAYFTMDQGLRLLLGLAPNDTIPLITVTSYLGYVIMMTFVFGIAFELPLLVLILNMAGVLTHERIKKWRRGIIFGVFVFAAVVTPSPDPFMMCIMAVPTVVLFEVAEGLAYLHDKRVAANDPYAGLSDDEASPLDAEDDRLESDRQA